MARNSVDFFKETDLLLEQWGRWCRADGNKFGYPSIEPFAKEMPRDLESSIALMTDDEAGDVERSMLLLQGCNLLAYKVAMYRYVYRNNLRITSIKLNIGHTKAKNEWNAAVHFTMANLYQNVKRMI